MEGTWTVENDLCIEAVGLQKKFGRTRALKALSLDIPKGEVLCVVGPNGAGKTTLLLLLGGIILPSSGHVKVLGLHRWKENFEIRKRSTFLSDTPLFGACLSPYDFLRFYAQIYGIPKAEFLDRVKELAEEMAMTEHLDKPWDKLSLGMKKKTGLIAIFLPPAELRIIDEPFAGGIDPMAMDRLYEWMQSAKTRGETVLFSTQVLEQAERASDRVLVLRDGARVAFDSPQNMVHQTGLDPSDPRAFNKALLKLMDGNSGSPS